MIQTDSSPEQDAHQAPGRASETLAAHIAALRDGTTQEKQRQSQETSQPSGSRLLGEALATRHIRTQKITEGRWVFIFAGTVIGGFANGVTTLVSAHARRVLADPASVRAHLDLMEVPRPPAPEEETDQTQTPPLFDLDTPAGAEDHDALMLRAYVVGRDTPSMLAVIPGDHGRPLTVDVTDKVSEDLRTLAVDAMRAIPGLSTAGVSMAVTSMETSEGAEILGIDETASIVPHHFPTIGEGRAVAEALADYILATAAL